MSYTQINAEERSKLEAWKEANLSQGEMARRLGRHPSTIGRELSRNGESRSGWYVGKKAEKFRRDRRRDTNHNVHAKLIEGSSLALYVEARLKSHWSPEQITGRLKRDKKESVSHERIYLWIYKERKDLISFLRHSKKRRYRRRNGTKQRENRSEEAKKKRIDTRPNLIEKRIRLGDFEGDTIVGAEKTQHILTHVDRKSRFLVADKVTHATAENVRKITVRRFNQIPKKKRYTITYDNGVQFTEHQTLERDLGLHVYFAYPYHSWERGTNENTNGITVWEN